MDGWYYLHTNGELIYKPDPEAAADIRDSTFARGLWAIDAEDRLTAWNVLVEALAAGATKARVDVLAHKWRCDDKDAINYAQRVGCSLRRDGNAWMAARHDFEDIQSSPCGFGDTCLEAMADLARVLGYQPALMWPTTFKDLLQVKAVANG
jgi:hypothetical protein